MFKFGWRELWLRWWSFCNCDFRLLTHCCCACCQRRCVQSFLKTIRVGIKCHSFESRFFSNQIVAARHKSQKPLDLDSKIACMSIVFRARLRHHFRASLWWAMCLSLQTGQQHHARGVCLEISRRRQRILCNPRWRRRPSNWSEEIRPFSILYTVFWACTGDDHVGILNSKQDTACATVTYKTWSILNTI